MADVSKAIEVIFTGVDDLSQTVAKIGGGMDDLAGNLQSVTDPLANLGTDILKLEAALAALAVGGLALAAAKAGEFGDSFNEIATLIQAPTENIEQFKDDILDYSQTSTQSLAQITAATYATISATGDWENSLELLAIAEKLAVGGSAELEASTQTLSTTLNAYGAGVDQAADFSDVFFTIVKDGVTTIPLLSTSIAQVTGFAAAAGIPFSTLGAAIAALTGFTGQTAQSMTSLRAAIAAIVAPTEATNAAAEALGIELGQSAIDGRGFEGVLKDIFDATGGNLEQIKKLIPSIEGAQAVLLLGTDAGGKFANALKDMEVRAGATEEAYQKMADNFGLINQQLSNNVNAVLILIGDKILDSYKGVADGVIDVMLALAKEIEAGTFDEIFDRITELGNRLRDQLQTLAKNIPAALENIDFGGLLSSFDQLLAQIQGIFGDFFSGIDLSTPEGLALAIQKIIDSITTLNDVTTGIISGLRPFVEILGDILDKMNDLDPALKAVFGEILGFSIGITPVIAAFGALGLAIEGGALAIGGLSRAFGAKGGAGLIGGLGTLSPLLTQVTAAWIAWEAGTKIGTALYENNDAVRALADSTAEWIGELLTGVDIQEETNKLLAAGTELTDEQIEAYKKRTAALEETPEEITTKFGVEVSQGQEIFDFIIANSDAGATGVEILAGLKAFYADTESEELIDWVQVEDTIDKFVDVEVTGTEEIVEAQQKITDLEAAALKSKETIQTALKFRAEVELGKYQEDTERIKARAITIQKALEFKASVDVAELQVLQATIDGISATFQSTGDVLGDAFGSLADISKAFGPFSDPIKKILASIDQEQALRQASFDLQEKLTNAEIALLDEKTKRLRSGDALITITADGLEPELEAFMWQILERIQLRAAADQAEFLLGI